MVKTTCNVNNKLLKIKAQRVVFSFPCKKYKVIRNLNHYFNSLKKTQLTSCSLTFFKFHFQSSTIFIIATAEHGLVNFPLEVM